MHLPDGILAGHTEVVLGVGAVTGVGLAARSARNELAEVGASRFAAVTSLVFAGQMVNFPVANGTSGHLIGAALAVTLLGPGLGILAVTAVLMAQAFLFADGGTTSLAANIVNLAIVPGLVAWAALRRWDRVEVAAFLSVVAASLTFSLEYAAGGLGGASTELVLRDMLGLHLLIALGETALVTAVVYADRKWEPTPGALVAAAAGVTLLFAPWANPNPDGLQRVAIDRGFASLERAPDFVTPLAGYATSGVSHGQLSVAIAGLLGVAAVGAASWLVGRSITPRRAGA